jgi:hypothetical protein
MVLIHQIHQDLEFKTTPEIKLSIFASVAIPGSASSLADIEANVLNDDVGVLELVVGRGPSPGLQSL